MSFKEQPGRGRLPNSALWTEQFCLSQWCRAGRWYVRPDSNSQNLWLISESPDAAPWSVAAAQAVCPLCGVALAAHVEGVGEIEGEVPATIIRFIRTLERAA
jgi:hypothetical protein